MEVLVFRLTLELSLATLPSLELELLRIWTTLLPLVMLLVSGFVEPNYMIRLFATTD